MAVPPSEPSTSGRKIVFAVDGTSDAENGLRWVAKELAQKGDTIYLAHVLCDARTPATAVGSSTAATQWSPGRDEAVFAKEFFLRLEHEANAMLQARFVPALQFTGVGYEVALLRMRTHKSAAGIGEVICDRAANLGADLVVIASHGAGVLADYGSVARWCSDNSRVPVLLLPPSVLAGTDGARLGTSLMVAAAGDSAGLPAALEFAARVLSRPSDNIYVVHAVQSAEQEEGVVARKRLLRLAAEWQAGSAVPHAATLNVAVDVLPGATEIGEDGSSVAGQRLCQYAADFNAREVVLVHHGDSMMAEMMYSPVTMQVTKFCPRPLVVLRATT